MQATTARVDLGAIRSNVAVIRSLAGDRTVHLLSRDVGAGPTLEEVCSWELTGKAAYAYFP